MEEQIDQVDNRLDHVDHVDQVGQVDHVDHVGQVDQVYQVDYRPESPDQDLLMRIEEQISTQVAKTERYWLDHNRLQIFVVRSSTNMCLF